MVSQKNVQTNKTIKDFSRENKNFPRNFDRNFTNVLEQNDDIDQVPLYEYYMDPHGVNKIIVNRLVKFQSNPPKYEVGVNGSKSILTSDDIQKLLQTINAIRVDEILFKKYSAK